MEQVVDPAISRGKFDRELRAFRKLGGMHRARGWWLMSAEFPVVRIAFATPRVRPATIAVCARIDFTNYDFWAPSVTFVDPFTDRPLLAEEIQLPFARRLPDGQIQNMLQFHTGRTPFLCLPGVREYHEHPAHTGDSWLLHRDRGEGGLNFLADKISKYGSETITAMGIEMKVVPQQGIFPS